MRIKKEKDALLGRASRVGQDATRELRRRIVSGNWAPGSPLPTWDALANRLGVGRTTLAKAVRQLKREGFVYAESTRGMFVSARPPHLHRFGLVFRAEPSEPGWNRFWWTLANLATVVTRSGAAEVATYYGVSEDERSEGRQRLLSDLQRGRLAGLVLAAHVPELAVDFAEFPEVPVLRLGQPEPRAAMPVIGHDWPAFFERACAHLAARGRRRVALILSPGGVELPLAPILARHGLTTQPHWAVPVHVHNRAAACVVAQLLLDRPAAQRPDALIVADDNLVAPALQGVLAQGLTVPRDLDAVVHCNWPTDAEPILPVRQLGFDAAALLDAALACLARARHERNPVDSLLLPPVFDDEYAQSTRRRAASPSQPLVPSGGQP